MKRKAPDEAEKGEYLYFCLLAQDHHRLWLPYARDEAYILSLLPRTAECGNIPAFVRHDDMAHSYRRLARNAAEALNRNLFDWAIERGCLVDAPLMADLAASGNIAAVSFLREQGHDWDEQVISAACSAKRYELAKWAIAEGCPLPTDLEFFVSMAAEGDIENFAYFSERIFIGESLLLACLSACRSQEMALYLMESKTKSVTRIELGNRLLSCASAAAREGNITWLEWLWTEKQLTWGDGNGAITCRYYWKIGTNAVKKGQMAVLEWLAAKEYKWTFDCTARAVAMGRLDIVLWLQRHNPNFHRHFDAYLDEAASTGRLEIIQALLSEKASYPRNQIFRCACTHGRLVVAKWAFSPDTLQDVGICTSFDDALMVKDLSVATWLYDEVMAGKPIEPWIMDNPMRSFVDDLLLRRLAHMAHIDALQWLAERNLLPRVLPESLFSDAAKSVAHVDALRFIQFLYFRRGVQPNYQTLSDAAHSENLDLVRWLLTHNPSFPRILRLQTSLAIVDLLYPHATSVYREASFHGPRIIMTFPSKHDPM